MAACLTAVVLIGHQASAAPVTRPVPGSVPVWASPAAQRGDAPDGEVVQIRVYLPWRDPDGAARLAAAVSTPGSSRYGRHLKPQQFRDRFSPTRSDVDEVKTWLRKAGLRTGYVPANRHYVTATGTVAQIEGAFDTQLARFTYRGQTLRAPRSQLRVPAGLQVAAVVGVDESARLVHPPHAEPFPVIGTAAPCSTWWGEKTTATAPAVDGTTLPDVNGTALPWAPCGYEPAQLRGAYGLGAGQDGHGVTVAVVNAFGSDTISEDLARYSARHGLPRPNLRRVTLPGTIAPPPSQPCDCDDPPSWGVEETLDLAAIHAIAPAARLVSVIAPHSSDDLDAALNHAVDEHLASIISNSWTTGTEDIPADLVRAFDDTAIQAAATGIGLYFATGNDGDRDPVNPEVTGPDWEASSPWVTAVGGTSLAMDRHNRRLFETGWETGRSRLLNGTYTPPIPGQWVFGATGGTSHLFGQPAYQTSVVPDQIARAHGGQPMRVVPDVAALGDTTTGILIGRTALFADGHSEYIEHRIGGTSLASPLFAATIAVAQQGRHAPVGFANPLLYTLAGSPALHDITPAAGLALARPDFANGADPTDGFVYSAMTLGFDQPLTIHTRHGYDDVTGLGTSGGRDFLTAIRHTT